jgi:hypothetical protein
MLTPIKSCVDSTPFFVVCDIETDARKGENEGKVLAIDTCWRDEYGNFEHIGHDDWYWWWEWLKDRARADKRFRTIYAHNGGGFDWLSFIERMLKWVGEKRKISCACAGSRLITCHICIERGEGGSGQAGDGNGGGGGGGRGTRNENKQQTGWGINLCDSLQLLRSSLDKLGKAFTGTGKQVVDDLPHVLFERSREEFDKYHQRDTELLLEVMERSFLLTNKNIAPIGEFGFTIGSTAMKCYRAGGMNWQDDPALGNTSTIMIPQDKKLKEFLREGYRGGRVECFRQGEFSGVSVYDINSLYPAVMRRTQVPVSDRGVWYGGVGEALPSGNSLNRNSLNGNSLNGIELSFPSLYRIRFSQTNRKIFPVLMVNGVGVYEGEGVYFSPELSLLMEVDPNVHIEMVEGFAFMDSACIFTGFVDRLYALRLKYKDGPIDLLAKYILNSLYGKFGQHAIRSNIIADNDDEWQRELDSIPEFGESRITAINAELGIGKVEEESIVAFEHVGIAGMITSEARATLYRGLYNAARTMGRDKVVYCDTDSIHLADGATLSGDLVGIELGKFKREFQGVGIYVGKKLYALKNGEMEKIRTKGVSLNGNFGMKMDYAHFARILKEGMLKCEFSQFSTPMEIFKGKGKACQLQKRTRTLNLNRK